MNPDELFAAAQAAQRGGKPEESERLCRAALEIEAGHAGANRMLGVILLEQRGEPAQARACFARAIAAKPDQPSFHQNMAMALGMLGDDAGALAACDRALWLQPSYALAHFNRGEILLNLSRFHEAIASFQAAIVRGLADGRPYCGMGIGYYLLERFDVARACFEDARKRSPELPGLNAKIMFCTMRICDWATFDAAARALIEDVDIRKAQTEPFMFLALPTTSAQQRRCAEIFAAKECPPQPPLARTGPRRGGRLRIAYISKDFSDHPVTYLIAETLERHNRDDFEIFAVSYGPDKKDGGRKRIADAVDHFIDVRIMTDRRAAEEIAALDIDIAVDLVGHTRDARPGILARRPARLQVNYLGYAGTIGAGHLDYLIGDGIVTPPDHAAYYSEKLVQLPVCYLPASSRPGPRENNVVTRVACGLPENDIVFCAFNNSYKITPEVFSLWMRLLERLPGSVLWLRDDNILAARNLKREARARNLDPARLVFSPHAGAREHFARLALADLFLDTWPYNAHTTASDALWAGVPVVTLLGETFPGRVAASLLTDAGLTDLIAHSPAEYESMALKLATDRVWRDQAKARLSQSRARMFDAAAFTHHLENAYRTMAARAEQGEPPEGFAVTP